MRGITVDLDIEDMSTACQIMIRCLHLGLMARRTFIVDRHMIGVRVIIAIRYTRNDTKLLAVLLRELASKTLCRCGEYGVVVVILIAELVHTVAHIGDNLQSQLLCLLALAMVLTNESHKALCQSNEADTQRTLIDDALDGIGRSQFLCTYPEALHQQRELLGESCLLELITVVELLGSHLEHVVELGKEQCDALLFHIIAQHFTFHFSTFHFQHALDGELHDVDGGKRQVTTPDTRPWTETVLEHTCTTAHRSHLVEVALRIIGFPVTILIKGGVEIQEVREESASSHLTGQLIEVEVTILGQIVHATLLLPYLDGEDGCLTTTHALVGREEDLAHHAAPFRARIRTIINRGEHHLITTTRVDGVHIVDKGLHRLMHTPNGLVDGMLLCAFLTCQTVKRHLQIVHQRLVVQILVILAVKFFECLQLLDISEAHIRSQIEVESRYRLSSVHLVLAALHRDTCQNRSRLDALGRARGAMPRHESAIQNMIQRMLHAGKRLCWIIVLIVDMQIVVLHSVATVLRQQIVVDEGLRRLRGELHHHTCRCVGVHVCILARHVVVLNVHDIEEHLARFGLTCHTALVAIGDVLLCHVLAA